MADFGLELPDIDKHRARQALEMITGNTDLGVAYLFDPGGPPAEEMFDPVPAGRYDTARSTLMAIVEQMAEQFVADPLEHGMRAAPMMTVLALLDEIPATTDDLLPLAVEVLNTGSTMAFDDLFTVGPMFGKVGRAKLLNAVAAAGVISPQEAAHIKKSLRNPIIGNDLMLFDKEGEEKLSDRIPENFTADFEPTDSARTFADTLAQAKDTDDILPFTVGLLGGPKSFLRREAADEASVAMVRRMELEHFVAWLAAYETDWNSHGFSHVPVEPIFDFVIDEHRMTVDVRTMVIPQATPFHVGCQQHPEHQDHLLDEVGRLSRTLTDIGVSHGHLHEGNILVSPSEAGPLIHVIDFDKGVLTRTLQTSD